MLANFPDCRKVTAPTPRPFAPEPHRACQRDYDISKAALLASVAEPRQLTGARDTETWDARWREYQTAKQRFDAVYNALDHSPELIVDYRQTLRAASKLLDATVAAPARLERRWADDVDCNVYVEGRDGSVIGSIVSDGRQFQAVAADGTDLGAFADPQSASAAIRADANR